MGTDLRFRQVSHSYGEGAEALTGIDLTIRQGESVAVVGANGAGKSTLIRHGNGLLKPTAGRVEINGVDTRNVSVAAFAGTVGLVFQNPDDQLFCRSVRDEVNFGLVQLGIRGEEGDRRLAAALASTGLSSVETSNPYDLSPARRRLVAIASVLAMDPDVIIFDEPTMGQDGRGLALLDSLMRTLKSMGKTVIVVSHHMEFCAAHCHRLLVLSRGRILADGPSAAIFCDVPLLERASIRQPQLTRLATMIGLVPGLDTVDSLLDAVREQHRKDGRAIS